MPITSSVSPDVIAAYGEVEQQRKVAAAAAAGNGPAGMAAQAAPAPSKRTFRFSFLQLLLIISGLAIVAAVVRAYGLYGAKGIWSAVPQPQNDSAGAAGAISAPTDLLAPLMAVSLTVERLIETGFAWYERATRKASDVLKQFQDTGEWVGRELNNAIQAVENAASKLGADVQTDDLIRFNLAKQRLADAEELIHGWVKAPEYVAFKRASSIMIGIVAGLVVSIGGDLGLLRAIGIPAPPVLDMVITGFAVGSGPGPMHTLIGMLQGAKDSLTGLASKLGNNPVSNEVDKLWADVTRLNMINAQQQSERPVELLSGDHIVTGTQEQPMTSPPGPGADGAWG